MLKSQPFLTDEDLQKLLNAPINCHPSQKFVMNTIIQLLWDSGARISEVTNLKIEDFDPDQKFLTFKNLFEINQKTKAPIALYMMDMATVTGGCHYAWDCKGYLNNCGSCPGIYSDDPNDISRKNLLFKKK